MKLFAFTLDLESEYGLPDQYEIFKNLDEIEEILSTITSAGVKITAYTRGDIFEPYAEVIKLFEQYNCEFELHSFSHNLDCPDTKEEIEKAKSAYVKYFGLNPKGYRAPQGRISESGIKFLEEYGFLYDSSVFPSYFPNPFRYLLRNRKVHYYDKYNIMEIPFASITPLRITLSISFIKFFGLSFYMNLSKLFGLPDIICFDSHLHDFIFKQTSYDKLTPFLKFFCGRNRFRGTEYFMKYIEYIKSEGYSFCYMSEIYELHKKDLSA